MISRLALASVLIWPIYAVVVFLSMSAAFSTTAFVGSFYLALPLIGVGTLIASGAVAYLLAWSIELLAQRQAQPAQSASRTS